MQCFHHGKNKAIDTEEVAGHRGVGAIDVQQRKAARVASPLQLESQQEIRLAQMFERYVDVESLVIGAYLHFSRTKRT